MLWAPVFRATYVSCGVAVLFPILAGLRPAGPGYTVADGKASAQRSLNSTSKSLEAFRAIRIDSDAALLAGDRFLHHEIHTEKDMAQPS